MVIRAAILAALLAATCRAAWTGEATRHGPGGHGFGYVTPRPYRPGGPPIWVGALSEPDV